MHLKHHGLMRSRLWRTPQSGFTLIELLVALSVMALLALLSWRSIDGMTRSLTDLGARSDEALTLQVSLAQFRSDLDAMAQLPRINSLDWDGRVLRLTRLAAAPAEGLQVVAWTRRFDDGGKWLRWQSPTTTAHTDWRSSWEQAAAWGQSASPENQKRETFVVQLADWQIFYFRNNAWSNPLSSDGAPAKQQLTGTPSQVSIPDGIRLVLSLPASQRMAGKLTLDWVRSDLGRDKP
jgi:general secretion pathway protein J